MQIKHFEISKFVDHQFHVQGKLMFYYKIYRFTSLQLVNCWSNSVNWSISNIAEEKIGIDSNRKGNQLLFSILSKHLLSTNYVSQSASNGGKLKKLLQRGTYQKKNKYSKTAKWNFEGRCTVTLPINKINQNVGNQRNLNRNAMRKRLPRNE